MSHTDMPARRPHVQNVCFKTWGVTSAPSPARATAAPKASLMRLSGAARVSITYLGLPWPSLAASASWRLRQRRSIATSQSLTGPEARHRQCRHAAGAVAFEATGAGGGPHSFQVCRGRGIRPRWRDAEQRLISRTASLLHLLSRRPARPGQHSHGQADQKICAINCMTSANVGRLNCSACPRPGHFHGCCLGLLPKIYVYS
jgi:hypothetical protein